MNTTPAYDPITSHPTAEAIMATIVFLDDYSRQAAPAMTFYAHLPPMQRQACINLVKRIEEALLTTGRLRLAPANTP